MLNHLNHHLMKKKLSILFSALLISIPLVAQQHLFLEEKEIIIGGNNATAWVFPVEGEIDGALDHLEDYCKERSDIKMKKEGDNLLIAEEVSIATIAKQRGDMIGYGFPLESYNALGIAFKLGYDIYLNSTLWNMEMNNLRNYAKEFMSYHYERSYSERIAAAEDEIKSLERELGKTERDVGKLEKDIERTNGKLADETDPAKVEEMKAELLTLNADLEKLKETIPHLRSRIELLQGDVGNLKDESLTIQSAISSI